MNHQQANVNGFYRKERGDHGGHADGIGLTQSRNVAKFMYVDLFTPRRQDAKFLGMGSL